MKLFSKLILLVAFCFSGQLHADWKVTLKDGSKVTLSVCKENLDREREVFNKSFTNAYKGTEIEKMILAKQERLQKKVGLAHFLVDAFEDEQNDFNDNKKDTLFISAKTKKGEVIGFVAFDKNPDHVYIRQLSVSPENQKSGVGVALTWSFLNVWKDCACVKFVTRKLNSGAIKFYKKLEFKDSEFKHGSYDPDVYMGMERNLGEDDVNEMLKKYKIVN